MSTERRRCAAFAIVLAFVLAGAGCGHEREPVRIGVLADCTGILSTLRDVTLADAVKLVRGARR